MGAAKRRARPSREAAPPPLSPNGLTGLTDFHKGLSIGLVVAVVAVVLVSQSQPFSPQYLGQKRNVVVATSAQADGVAAGLVSRATELTRDGKPFLARDILKSALQEEAALQSQLGRPWEPRRKVLVKLGEQYRYLKQPGKAFETHKEAHRLLTLGPLGSDVTEVAVSFVTLATCLYLDHKFDEALQTVSAISSTVELPPPAAAVVLKLESTIYECKSDFITALQRLEQAHKIQAPANTEQIQRHMDLIKRVRENDRVPEDINKMMKVKQMQMLKSLTEHGPWESEWQLPKHFTPGLTAKPWHSIDEYQITHAASQFLETQQKQLLLEYFSLKEQGKMQREQECIHHAEGGTWSRYEITGIWQPLNLTTGCSIGTPIACQVFAELRRIGLHVIRAGYSVVQPKAWLKPHFGMSNAQLKFHLGLSVPGGDGSNQCAFFRVMNETRGWRNGTAIFFDDSFEHEVRNECDAERVVFQVVFVHPDLQS